MTKVIGLILLLLPFAAVYFWILIHTIYWLWKCYTEGGDYKYYLGQLAIIVSITIIGVGLILIIKG